MPRGRAVGVSVLVFDWPDEIAEFVKARALAKDAPSRLDIANEANERFKVILDGRIITKGMVIGKLNKMGVTSIDKRKLRRIQAKRASEISANNRAREAGTIRPAHQTKRTSGSLNTMKRIQALRELANKEQAEKQQDEQLQNELRKAPDVPHIGKAFLSLKKRECAYCVQGRGLTGVWCGLPVATGRPYCEGHTKLCYEPIVTRKVKPKTPQNKVAYYG